MWRHAALLICLGLAPVQTDAQATDPAQVLLPATPSLSTHDLQVMGQALSFVTPAPQGSALVAVVYDPSDPGSRADAMRVAGQFGDGISAGDATLHAEVVAANALSDEPYAALVAARGAPEDVIMALARLRHIACVTGVLSEVQDGHCTLWIQSEPKVEIVMSHAAAAASGLDLATAFRMMISEL